MGVLKIILVICVLYGVYDSHLVPALTGLKVAAAPSQAAAVLPVPAAPMANMPAGVHLSSTMRLAPGQRAVTQQDMQYINKEVGRKYYSQEYTNIRMPDGRVIPLQFQPNGLICSRTHLPEMTITVPNIVLVN